MVFSSPPVIIDLDDRLECYGSFNPKDYVCLSYCALSLNCAVAYKNYIDGQMKEDMFVSLS